MNYDDISVGQSVTEMKVITRRDVEDFIHLTGDNNPVHLGEGAIVHGMLVMSFVSTIIGTKLPGKGSVWMKTAVTFISPVRIGDELRLTATVIAKDDLNHKILLAVDAHNQDEDYVLACTCNVKKP